MPEFRKKPVVITAVQLRWDTWDEMCAHAGVGRIEDNKPTGCYIDPEGQPHRGMTSTGEMGMLIPTLEGVMVARENDWVIKGVQGELYPCKPDIFEATYESVDG